MKRFMKRFKKQGLSKDRRTKRERAEYALLKRNQRKAMRRKTHVWEDVIEFDPTFKKDFKEPL